jgi:hypothetical protein
MDTLDIAINYNMSTKRAYVNPYWECEMEGFIVGASWKCDGTLISAPYPNDPPYQDCSNYGIVDTRSAAMILAGCCPAALL